MAARKPNNLPWIILGVVCGLAVLGLFGFGVYSGAKAVSDEMAVTIPEPPDKNERAALKNKLTIFVNADDEISFEDVSFKDVVALKAALLARDKGELKETVFVLQLNEDGTHRALISIKDMLDELGVESKIKIERNRAE